MDETKVLAFVVGILLKVINDDNVTGNEMQQLENIADEIGTYRLEKREFRY